MTPPLGTAARTRRTPGGARKARAPADKEARAASLVAAARAELDEGSYADITMLAIARRAGLAKGTLYLYFPSKEALFLAVLKDELELCFADLEAALADGARTPEAAARAIARALTGRQPLTGLLSLLHTQLEPGAGQEAVHAFKTFLKTRLDEVGAAIDAACRLAAGRGRQLILRAHALAIGLGQMASTPEVARTVMREDPALAMPELSVEDELAASLADMIGASSGS